MREGFVSTVMYEPSGGEPGQLMPGGHPSYEIVSQGQLPALAIEVYAAGESPLVADGDVAVLPDLHVLRYERHVHALGVAGVGGGPVGDVQPAAAGHNQELLAAYRGARVEIDAHAGLDGHALLQPEVHVAGGESILVRKLQHHRAHLGDALTFVDLMQ